MSELFFRKALNSLRYLQIIVTNSQPAEMKQQNENSSGELNTAEFSPVFFPWSLRASVQDMHQCVFLCEKELSRPSAYKSGLGGV
jgi:hypothetical protein